MSNLSEATLKQLTVGPSRSRVGRDRQRRDASDRAAFRRAGMRYSQTGGQRQRFNSTNDQNQYTRTAITSYPSQSAYARDMIPDKVKDGRVVSTRDRALYLKRLKRQLKTTRARRGVHAVDILPKGAFTKNDSRELVSRGKEYHQVIDDISKEIEKSGGKKGDKIIGKAAEVMIGSTNPEQGRRKRRALYSKKLGATEHDPITKVQVATVREEITFFQFLHEAREATRATTRGRRLNSGATQQAVARDDRRRAAQERAAERKETQADEIISSLQQQGREEREAASARANPEKHRKAALRRTLAQRMADAAKKRGIDETYGDYEKERLRRRSLTTSEKEVDPILNKLIRLLNRRRRV